MSLLFSVIIPCFESAATIERALDSVFAQTRADFEVLVIDDGSTDGTADRVKKAVAVESATAPGRVRLFTQENRGPAAARNRGMREAVGGAIAFLDADDYWEPEYLAEMENVFERFPAVGAISSNYYVVDSTGVHEAWGSLQRIRRSAVPTLHHSLATPYVAGDAFPVCDYLRFKASTRIGVSTSGVVLLRSTIEKAGFMREDLSRSEDTEYWARIAARGISWAFHPRPLSSVDRTSAGSVSRERSGSWCARVPLPELWSRDIWPVLAPQMAPSFTVLYLQHSRYLCTLFLEARVGEMAKKTAKEALRHAGGRPLEQLHLWFVAAMPPPLTWALWRFAVWVRRAGRRS